MQLSQDIQKPISQSVDPIFRIIGRLNDQPSFHEVFLKGQRAALAAMGLQDLVPTAFTDSALKNIAAVGVFHGDEIVGGIKIHFKNAGHQMPVEHIYPKHGDYTVLENKIAALNSVGVAELCSLWVSPDTRGRMYAPQIIRTAAEHVFARGYAAALGFIGPAIKSSLRAGFVLDEEVPPVFYPNEKYVSKVVWCFRDNGVKNIV